MHNGHVCHYCIILFCLAHFAMLDNYICRGICNPNLIFYTYGGVADVLSIEYFVFWIIFLSISQFVLM